MDCVGTIAAASVAVVVGVDAGVVAVRVLQALLLRWIPLRLPSWHSVCVVDACGLWEHDSGAMLPLCVSPSPPPDTILHTPILKGLAPIPPPRLVGVEF